MNIDFTEITMKTVPVADYINGLEEPFKEKFLARKLSYQLDQETIGKLKAYAGSYAIIVFSAGWCKDCAKHVPVLALINETTGLEVRVFGGLKKDPLAHGIKWRIPPSPPDVETFHVEAIPLIIVVDREGRELGRIIENPKHQPTLEQELFDIITSGLR